MDVKMWGRAVVGIPRLDREQWDRLDVFSRWLVATRSAVLVMTLLAAAIAGILAWKADLFDPLLFGLVTVGLLAAHAGNNLLNDLTDHRRGTDRDNSFRTQYGLQPLEEGLMTVRQNLAHAAVTGVVGLGAGIYLAAVRGPVVVLLLVAGALLAVFYTWPLKQVGLGEPAVLVTWGPLMVASGYYAITGAWSWQVVLASLPYALGVTAVLFGKHIDKLPGDRERGIRTLPVLLGEAPARTTVLVLVAAQYFLVAYLIATGFLGWPLLVVLGALPLLRYLVPVFRHEKPSGPPEGYPAAAWPLWYVSFAFVHNRRFGVLYLLGLLADVISRRLS